MEAELNGETSRPRATRRDATDGEAFARRLRCSSPSVLESGLWFLCLGCEEHSSCSQLNSKSVCGLCERRRREPPKLGLSKSSFGIREVIGSNSVEV